MLAQEPSPYSDKKASRVSILFYPAGRAILPETVSVTGSERICGCHYMPISKLISEPTNCYALMFRQVSTQLGGEKWRHPNHMDWKWGRISSSSLEENWGALPRRRWNRYSKNDDYRNQGKSVKEGGSQQCHMTQRLKKMGSKWAQCTLDPWLSHLLF